MDELKNKNYIQYDYISRYSSVPYYYNTKYKKELYGIGTSMKLDLNYILHEVRQEDTLDKIALKYYNNPTYWWVIAEFNTITDPTIRLIERYSTLRIPNISNIEFGADR